MLYCRGSNVDSVGCLTGRLYTGLRRGQVLRLPVRRQVFPPGTVVTFWIVKPRHIGQLVDMYIGKRGRVRVKRRCYFPVAGVTRKGRCPKR